MRQLHFLCGGFAHNRWPRKPFMLLLLLLLQNMFTGSRPLFSSQVYLVTSLGWYTAVCLAVFGWMTSQF